MRGRSPFSCIQTCSLHPVIVGLNIWAILWKKHRGGRTDADAKLRISAALASVADGGGSISERIEEGERERERESGSQSHAGSQISALISNSWSYSSYSSIRRELLADTL